MSDCTSIACWLIGSRPHFIADTATAARVCVWITQLISGRAACMQLWMMKPASFTPRPTGSSLILPSQSIFTRLEAVISSNISP